MKFLENGKLRLLTLSMECWLAVAAVLIFLLFYSQALAWTGDESFHLLAAMSINAGKTPYLDFFYQHPPMYIYLTAAWMRIFGETWRSVHVMSVLLTVAGIVLMADFLFSRLPESRWRPGATAFATLLAGLELQTMRAGVVAQQYGLCIFLLALAFRLAIASVDRQKGLLPAWAGVCAGSAASSNLLTAPAAPILMVWMLRQSKPETHAYKSIRYLAGAAVPFIPLLVLFARAPRHVFFNLIQYHLFHRREEGLGLAWNTFRMDFKALTGWIDASQPVFLILLAALGLAFVTGPDWPLRKRSEFLLCLWLAAGLGLLAACAHPTFYLYFVTTIPYLSVLAGAGLYALACQIWAPRRGLGIFLALAGVYCASPLKMIYRELPYREWTWPYYDALAKEVQRLTPKGGRAYVENQHVYVISRLPFPPGLENYHVGKLGKLPAQQAESLGYGTEARLREQVLAGRFATVVVWPDEHKSLFDDLVSSKLYSRQEAFGKAQVFWDRR